MRWPSLGQEDAGSVGLTRTRSAALGLVIQRRPMRYDELSGGSDTSEYVLPAGGILPPTVMKSVWHGQGRPSTCPEDCPARPAGAPASRWPLSRGEVACSTLAQLLLGPGYQFTSRVLW
jgi:hypothetical protein